PILHSFKNAQHLRVGVRDILGKDDIRDTHATLAMVADNCIRQIAHYERERLQQKFGKPMIGPIAPDAEVADESRQRFASREGDTCELVILALGKLGGREPNYHSDLDLVFLYEADGMTFFTGRGSGYSTSNSHFFSELG